MEEGIESMERESLLKRIDHKLNKWSDSFVGFSTWLVGKVIGDQYNEEVEITMFKPVRDELLDICGVCIIGDELNVELKNPAHGTYMTFSGLNKNLKKFCLPFGPLDNIEETMVTIHINDDNTFDLEGY